MTVEQKAKEAAAAVVEASKTPLFAAMPSAKKAVLMLAQSVEALAHESEILKLRIEKIEGGGNG